MSNLKSIINQLIRELDQCYRDLSRHTQLTKYEWNGPARQQFDQSQSELKVRVNQLKGELETLKNQVGLLEYSMQEADRDLAQKAMEANKL